MSQHSTYYGPERRHYARFSDDQYEEIADRVAKVLQERFYSALGKWAFRRFLLVAGAATGAAYVMFKVFAHLLEKGVI